MLEVVNIVASWIKFFNMDSHILIDTKTRSVNRLN